MAFKPPIAVFDASILYPFHLRNVVVQAAVDRLVEARWTETIHDEWIRSLAAGAAAIPLARLRRTCQLMNDALPAAMVRGYEGYVRAVNLPDPGDRHVVAAGIAAGASTILTWNLRHFPVTELKRFGLRRCTPDVFLCDLYDEIPDLIVGSLANARRNLTKSRISAQEFLIILGNQRLVQLARRLQGHLVRLQLLSWDQSVRCAISPHRRRIASGARA